MSLAYIQCDFPVDGEICVLFGWEIGSDGVSALASPGRVKMINNMNRNMNFLIVSLPNAAGHLPEGQRNIRKNTKDSIHLYRLKC